MAEYYPLLAKAVASLPDPTPEARQAIYDRARRALLGQLRNLQPPVPEADVERESASLDQAVAKLEAEFGGQPSAAQTEEPPASAVEPPPPATMEDPAPAVTEPAPQPPEPPVASPAQPLPESPLPASPLPASPELLSPALALKMPPLPPRPALPPLRAPSVKPPFPLATKAPVLRAAEPEPPPPEPPVTPAADVASVPEPETPPEAQAQSEAALRQENLDAAIAKLRPETQRPFAPQPKQEAGAPKRLWIVGIVVLLMVGLVAVAAWKLRDRPEDLALLKAAPPTHSESGTSGKIVDRIGGGTKPAEGKPPQPAPPSSNNAADDDSLRGSTESGSPVVPVARRAAFLMEAPDEPSKVKTATGTVLWRLDNVSNGPGEPLGTAVRADIDIPDDKLQAVLIFQKNSDPTLPASHTMKIQFILQPGNPVNAVQQISVPQMRREDTPTGEPLSGVPVPIMENSFLIGLSRGNVEATNLELIKTREWIDIPMLLGNGRVAKLTFEKGQGGSRAIAEALASWQSQ